MRTAGRFITVVFSLFVSTSSISGQSKTPVPFADDSAIAFFEQRIASDPEDTVALNRLGNLYLSKLRATGNHDYLDRAAALADASLRFVPAAQNRGGLLLQIRSRIGGHHFAEGEQLARTLISIDPREALGWQLLGDALMELGRYDEGAAAFSKAVELGGVTSASETRLARAALLHGRRAEAQRRFESAMKIAEGDHDRDTVAWCEWQLGDLAFSGGDFRNAQRHYDAALKINAYSIPALGSLARLVAARGNLTKAIAIYEKAIALDPVPPFVAALADLYSAKGNETKAKELFALIEKNASAPREQRLDRRHLARLYADHEMRLEKAYEYAAADYAERQDIYAADTLAWTALKLGRIEEAKKAMKEALRLGTEDAALYYHAGMVALASGEKEEAKRWLQRALKLNPQFDLLQARRAREALRRSGES